MVGFNYAVQYPLCFFIQIWYYYVILNRGRLLFCASKRSLTNNLTKKYVLQKMWQQTF